MEKEIFPYTPLSIIYFFVSILYNEFTSRRSIYIQVKVIGVYNYSNYRDIICIEHLFNNV